MDDGFSSYELQQIFETAASRLGSEFDITGSLVDLGSGEFEISRERARQLAKHKDQNDLDDTLVDGELVAMAISYADARDHDARVPRTWSGFAARTWNPKSRRSNLVRAGALIAAEIDRLDRSGE